MRSVGPRPPARDALTSLPTTTARFVRALPLVLAAGLLAYGLLSSAGVLGALLLVVILSLAGTLAFWARRADASARTVLGSTGTGALLCTPALLVVFFSFSSGGFFPDSVALGALAVGFLLVVRLGVSERPLAAFGPGALVPWSASRASPDGRCCPSSGRTPPAAPRSASTATFSTRSPLPCSRQSGARVSG